MTKKMVALFVLIASFLCAVTPAALVDSLSKLDILDHAQWSVYARYVDNPDTAIIDYNGDMSLASASSLKIVTLGLALNELGPNYRFKTRLYYDGSIDDNGVLHGDIVILGGGDPTLGGDQVGGVIRHDRLISLFAKEIKEAGIHSVTGSVVGDESLYEPYHVPGEWVWEDLGNYYGAGVTALCYCDNKYYLDFVPGTRKGEPADVLATRPNIPGLVYDNRMLTGSRGSGDNGYIVCGPNQYRARLHGTIPADTDRFTIKGAIPNPALLIAQHLESKLEKSGIPVVREARVNNIQKNYHHSGLLKTVYSPPLKLIAEITNKLSNNTYTEMLLLKIAHKNTGLGNTRNGIEEIKKYMDRLGVDRDGMYLVDACGLSRHNMITTKIFADYLASQTKERYFRDFYRSFARAGSKTDYGHVIYFCRNSEATENARVKTGYINGVRSHTGYVTTRSGRLLTFSLIANNYHCRTSRITKLHEQVVIALAEME